MLKFIILTLSISAVLARVPVQKLPIAGNKNFLEFMMQTSQITQADSSTSMDCFNYYVPILNGVTTKYETDFGICVKTAADARAQIDIKTQPHREDIESSSKKACDALNACQEHTDSLDYFSCYSEAGSGNVEIMNSISFNATEVLLSVRREYNEIADEENHCTAAAERAYVEDTGKTYDELQACLEGKTPVP